MLNEPLYTRPAWFILSKVEGYSGVRASPRQYLLAGRATRLYARAFFSVSVGAAILFDKFWLVRLALCDLQMCLKVCVG